MEEDELVGGLGRSDAGERTTGAGHGRGRGLGEAEGDRGRGAGRGTGAPNASQSSRIGKKKFVTRDLKSFFSSMSVSSSRPSTHGSEIGVAVESEEIQQQLVVVSQVESTEAEDMTEHAQAQTEQAQTQDEEESATVERAFSAMNIIKTDLRNRMSDEWLHDLILCYIEKEIFRGLDGGEIMKTFQAIKNRAIDLPRPPRRPRHD